MCCCWCMCACAWNWRDSTANFRDENEIKEKTAYVIRVKNSYACCANLVLIQWVFSFLPSFSRCLSLSCSLSVTLRTVERCVCILQCSLDWHWISKANCVYRMNIILCWRWVLDERERECVCVRASEWNEKGKKRVAAATGWWSKCHWNQSVRSESPALQLCAMDFCISICVCVLVCAYFISQSAIFQTQDFTTDHFLIAIRGTRI